jgi:hypothetical protein
LSSPPPVTLGGLDLWAIHVDRCVAVLRRALELLSKSHPPDPLKEVVLNRELYWCILAAQRELGALGQAPLAPVIPEGRNSPAAGDDERAPRENKIPDFQWGLTDDQAADVRESARHFVVECKCLITPRRKDWVYTQQYVTAGMRRFITRDHGYGMGVGNGAMVGYVRGLTFAEAHSEIDSHAVTEALPPLHEIADNTTDSTIDLAQHLDRPFKESPYYLVHLWQSL